MALHDPDGLLDLIDSCKLVGKDMFCALEMLGMIRDFDVALSNVECRIKIFPCDENEPLLFAARLLFVRAPNYSFPLNMKRKLQTMVDNLCAIKMLKEMRFSEQ